ncbi:MAG: type I restriction-modification system subunit M N-terminal domain-containing protein, partial [bacterium]
MNEQTLVSKVWNYAHVLRDEGIGYGDYVVQISFLLFLKRDEERTEYLGEPSLIPAEYQWATIKGKTGEA